MFSGAFTALVTPFRNGEVDVEALEGMVEFQIQGGIHGLVPCGTTGETPAMSEEEDRLVISTVVRVADGRVPVVAGTGSNSTDMAIKYTRTAEEEGADGSLQVSGFRLQASSRDCTSPTSGERGHVLIRDRHPRPDG